MEEEENFQLYSVEGGGEGGRHSLLKAPKYLAKRHQGVPSDQVFNILMADASGSMKERWKKVVSGWQRYIAGRLTGRSKIYIFDTIVRFLRNDKVLLEKDFTGYSTNLTAAFETIRLEISSCKESHVNVFLVTDGQHNFHEKVGRPESEIIQMAPPAGKTVRVFVLGIGCEFPVNYSIDIRSHLHNGCANVPTLFWAKEDVEIEEVMSAIGAELIATFAIIHLNVEGYILPGGDKTSRIHLGEWLYFPVAPEQLPVITVTVNDADFESLTMSPQEVEIGLLIDEVFRQWNSVMLQLHRKGSSVPYGTFSLMESLFKCSLEKLKANIKGNGIKSRIHSKLAKTCASEYAALMNQSKQVIDLDNQYKDEIQLAEAVLKTTVTNRKYDRKNLRLKGHGSNEFEADVEAFKTIYDDIRANILSLPSPSSDECCQLTHTSTLADLQDPDFPMVLEQNKFNFLKTFAMTGIPAYAPIRDASQINPWTITIRHLLSSPYAVLSQKALEACAEEDPGCLDAEEKFVLADKNDPKTKFNIIIPLVPTTATKILKPVVCSNLYAMLSTFCILKNPHVVDYDAHIASLAAAWVSTVRNFPIDGRPQFICNRLESIIATAKLYITRPSIKTYIAALLIDPDQALMTESTQEFEGHTVKSESLVKPMFFLYIMKNRLKEREKESLLEMLMAEFIGRCVPHCADYAKTSPFTEFFARDVSSPKKKEAWIENTLQALLCNLRGICHSLLEAFFTLDDLRLAIKKWVKEKGNISGPMPFENLLNIDMAKIKELRNFGGCGDVRASDFKCWAEEMGLGRASIKKAASPEMVTVYVCEALLNRNSRDRVLKAAMTKEDAMAIVHQRVMAETSLWLRSELLQKVYSYIEETWKHEYFIAHQNVVMPMTPIEVVKKATEKGIDVSLETFKQIYRYNDRLGLLRNACQLPSCPHYLVPRRNFNQHLSVERERKDFPHALHLVSKNLGPEGCDRVVEEVSQGSHSGTNYRRRPLPPPVDTLTPLKDQISRLIDRYTEER
ncbi:uncharacterized protein LOC135197866 [Macrobrachium nipponense]|uniref:uncharacterized protein LOC135197866 n=1 Tax=Macrobrachium nipponense TaxID=159736 RepID=UPI0030C84D74